MREGNEEIMAEGIHFIISWNDEKKVTSYGNAATFASMRDQRLLCCATSFKSSRQRCSIEKAVLKNFQYSQRNTYVGVKFIKVNFIKGTSNISVFLWILEIFENIYFEEYLWTTGSVVC